MAYIFKYRLIEAPEPRVNGSGVLDLFIQAVCSTNEGAFIPIPGYFRSVLLHFKDVKVVMDLPHSTTSEKNAKTAALKELIRVNAENSFAQPPMTWSTVGMTAWMLANDGASFEAGRLNSYLTVTLSQVYPIDFSL